MVSSRYLLKSVVYVTVGLGAVSVVLSLLTALLRGTFDYNVISGGGYIALGIWLFRGSDIARAVLAFLYFIGLVAGAIVVALMLVDPIQDFTMATIFLIGTVGSFFCFYILIFSKKFRLELAASKSFYADRELEKRKEFYKGYGEEYRE